jgi:tetratricopeptide (TPR) repeat protein
MIFHDKEIKFNRTPLDFIVLGFIALIGLGSFFSIDKVSNLLGFYGRFWPSLLGTLSLGGLYFLITNNVGIKNEKGEKTMPVALYTLIRLFLLSSFFVIANGFLSIFGIFAKLGDKIYPIMRSLSFNTIEGSLESLGIFLSIIVVLLTSMLAFKETIPYMRGKKCIPSYLLLFSALGLLALINIWSAWIILAISFIALIAFAFWKRVFKENVNRLGLSIFILIFSLTFLFINPMKNVLSSESQLMNLPYEVLLKGTTSWGIGLKGVTQNTVFGPGIANFGFNFSKFKPDGLLQTSFWSSRFDRSGNHLAEVLGTTGVLGFLGYLGFLGFSLLLAFKVINIKMKKSEVSDPSKFPSMPLFLTMITIVLSQLFYYQNAVLGFAFWLVLAGLVISWNKKSNVKSFSFKDFPEIGLVLNVAFWLLIAGFAAFSFSLGKQYTAEANYVKFLTGKGDISTMEQSVKLSPKNPTYRMTLAKAYWSMFLSESSKENPDDNYRANLVAASIDQAKIAQSLSPERVAVHETMAVIYRDSVGVVEGSEDWAFQTFERALELEPKNPVFLTELGRIKDFNEEPEAAKEYYQKASDLNSLYLDPKIQLAIISEQAEDIEGAITTLESAVVTNPYMVEARFQLGRMYYNADRVEDAKIQFESALLLYPQHSNSLYSLGLVYEELGEKDIAIQIFERVLELNPGNKEIQSKINSLKYVAPVEEEETEEE